MEEMKKAALILQGSDVRKLSLWCRTAGTLKEKNDKNTGPFLVERRETTNITSAGNSPSQVSF